MPESDAAISFSFAGIPGGSTYCFTTFERFALDIVGNMTGFLPGEYSVIIKSEGPIAAADRGKDWHLLTAGGVPTGRIYSWYAGKWVSAHPVEPSSKARIWWTGTEAELWAYDGGDGNDPSVPATAPTATTGAMYEKDEDYDFRFPLQAGTSPAPLSTTVSVGDVGGEEKHTLSLEETPAHAHDLFVCGSQGSTEDAQMAALQTSNNTIGASNPGYVANGGSSDYVEDTGGDASGVTVAHNNLPPYRVGMWAKRTIRVFYTA